MELEFVFVDGVLLVALTAFLASLGSTLKPLVRAQFPALFRVAGRIERRHPALFDGGDTFYCFFRKAALYGE